MKLAVVVLKNLSAQWLGAYGNEWVATPNLDRLAAEGIVFERHIAERTDGQPDSYAGDVKRFDDLVPPWDVPADVFETYAEEFEGLRPLREPAPFDANDLAAWDALRCSYAAVLTRLDAKLGRLFEELRTESRAILLTSDRGFPLGEHGIVGVADSRPHAELAHLPLIVRLPDASFAGYRVDAFTQPSDLLATVRHWSSIPAPPEAGPGDLSELWTGARPSIRQFAITDAGPNGRSIRTDDWTCLLSCAESSDKPARSARLHVWPNDRREANDLADRLPERVVELSELAGQA